jgi:hypothetical protein
MDIRKRAELLMRFIEICDAELFPNKPVTVYVINKSFISGRDTASYNNPLYLKMILLVPIIIIQYGITQLLFLAKPSLQRRKKVILSSYLLRSIKIACSRESYFVKKQKDLLGMDGIKVASIACHEVRHRFQYYYGRGELNKDGESYEDKNLFASYEAGRLKAHTFLKKLGEDDLEEESDAHFVQQVLIKRLVEKFPDGAFSKDDFRTFVKENKKILTWRNSYLRQR